MNVKELDSKNPNTMHLTQLVDKGLVVSTIRLSADIKGIDSMISLLGPVEGRADLTTPGNFETMVFKCDSEGRTTDWEELDFARYDSDEAAFVGHYEMVEKHAK